MQEAAARRGEGGHHEDADNGAAHGQQAQEKPDSAVRAHWMLLRERARTMRHEEAQLKEVDQSAKEEGDSHPDEMEA